MDAMAIARDIFADRDGGPLSIREAALVLGVPDCAIIALARDGAIGAQLESGRVVNISRASVRRWLSSGYDGGSR